MLAHVLLVDDREEDLEMTRIALFRRPKLRCNIHIARDGREAYDFLANSGFTVDLILLDINMPDVNGFELMPDVNGFELMQRMENAQLQTITIVMCSGSDHVPDQLRAQKLGAAGYLLKPPRYAQLKDIIDRLPSLILCQEGATTNLIRRKP